MTAHNIQDYHEPAAISNNMMFDQAIPDCSPMMDSANTKCTSRLVSAPYDDDEQMPAASPVSVSPCVSEEQAASADAISITGKFSNIDYKYHIDPRVIGTGQHGTVRECVDRATGQRYAVKSICKSDPTVKPGGLAREIMLLQEMKHCNIVQLVDVYEDADYVHLVTDLCTGGELFDKICEKSSNRDNGAACFAEDEAARIMYQILTAVSYMHKRGIVHRDIKPENILFETTDEDSPIKIIDFGLSRKHYGGQEPPMTSVVGTPYYIAPEVLRKKYDKSCDLWSVGVIAYILLCGYPPFNGANNDQTHRRVLRGRYYFPAEDWKDVSIEAMDFIHRMLQMDPRKRMTVKQALNHPWIVKHVNTDMMMNEEDRQDNSFVKVVYNETTRKHLVECSNSPTRSPMRKVSMSMFRLKLFVKTMRWKL
mmetsp:Transcript_1066/g.2121  ORF Transcript_1066/g.2121 Transcript_1066/m.2121 type:complete len:423 (-) Transcript_1066:34-1302(-)